MTRILVVTTGILFLALSALGWFTWGLHEDYVTEKNNAAVYKDARDELKLKVEKANETSAQYQRELGAIDRELADLRLQYKPSACVNVSQPERGSDGPGTGTILPDGNAERGLSPDWLFDFAGRCEKTRQKTIGLQNFYSVNN